ncbi:MAG: hypothetical protein IIB31_09065, partial [Chloroflexi bacterium]|nr:hypothetical protein [Chloroflexota bacterium]
MGAVQGESIMNARVRNFIKALGQASKSEKINIIMPREQFDEICNLKRKANFNSKSANEARSAISLIEKLQMSGASIELADMGIEAKEKAYADPVLIKLFDKYA